MFLTQKKQEINFLRAQKKLALCQDLLILWVNQNVEKKLKLLQQENYLKKLWQKVHNLIYMKSNQTRKY